MTHPKRGLEKSQASWCLEMASHATRSTASCRPRKGLLMVMLFCYRSASWTTDAFQTASPVQTRSCRRIWSGPNCLLSQMDPISSESTPAVAVEERSRDVAFVSPLLEYGYLPAVQEHEAGTLKEKPMLLLLPGFDGTYLTTFLQFPELHTIFDVRCMTVGMKDRSTFEELKEGVVDYLCSELAEGQPDLSKSTESPKTPAEEEELPNKGNLMTKLFSNRGATSVKPKFSSRPVYLIGESFGGILAAEVALSLLALQPSPMLKGLTLVNAATCYDRSRLCADGPAVAELHPLLYPAGLAKLLPMFADDYSIGQLFLMLQAKALPSVIDDEAREAYLGRVAFSLPFVLKYMSQETLKWRLHEWLEVGCTRMTSKLADFRRHQSFRTLIIAGEFDGALPSIAEAERLASVLPKAVVHVVEGAGHSSTCGSRVDLAALFRCHFRELIGRSGLWKRYDVPRTAMKEVAAAGKDEYYGMEPRYDGQSIGLSPLKYWNRKYYRKFQPIGKLNATRTE